ncbi:MAG: flagellar M-ring protein FliF C-terminal domain-containing protein [Lachnospiraceae bacterium]|nr:flagellar biosynthesis protein [Agathobacter sp.]MDD6445839.1 flagellar M-ring protein FliF C-terminal domain-containing protein [Lachnospiraceae bacterium]MDY4893266.1 flagellar M-ring protein FliF C-terminal domain-containing protein [Agathobacter sp.]
MPEQLQKVLNRLMEWWKKFTNKQRMLMISITAVVILALVILSVVVSRPTYTTLIDCENAKEASQVRELLESDGSIHYKVSNTTHFEVSTKDENKANWLLGSNDISTLGYDMSKADLSKVVNGSFATTEADKQKLYKEYLETKIAEDLASNELIDSAKVSLDIPNDDGTLLSRTQESSASVSLALTGDMDSDQAYSVARFVATALGNNSTEKITILDQKTSKILYSGADQDSESAIVSTNLDLKERVSNMMTDAIKDVMVKSGIYSDVQVAPNLDIDFDKVEKAVHNFSHNEGQDNGEITEKSEYYSEATGGQAAVPGTDANDDTPTYLTQDGETSSSSVSDVDTKYSPNEEIIKTISNGGGIKYANSSIAVAATRWVVYDEKQLKASGQLKGTTFDEFKAAHSDPVQVAATQDEIDLIAKATGIDPNSIKLVVTERPQFVDIEKKKISVTDILQIVLAVLIFALLGYVVFRSTRKEKTEEPEPELSVDALLAATGTQSEENLEDIGYTEKSETRLLIEKFVDENPDAAALLLRNWLNEDWE